MPDPASNSAGSTVVFLLNLGGPRSLEEVRPYLFELFSDPRDIIQLPAVLRVPLAALISTLRAPSSRQKYALIGNGSPLVAGSEAQAEALARQLGAGYRCYLAMRCGHPSTGEAVTAALAEGAARAVALPLYPQFARATSLSSLEALREAWPQRLPLVEVRSYPVDPLYLAAMESRLRDALAQLTPEAHARRLVIFSAHGLPMRDVRAGDPYESEVQHTARALVERCQLAEGEWQLTYQSRIRPSEWLGPDTLKTLAQTAKGRGIVLVPVSFVSEHLETLYDLDILALRACGEAGALQAVRAQALGTQPEFIEALAGQVRRALAAGPGGALAA